MKTEVSTFHLHDKLFVMLPNGIVCVGQRKRIGVPIWSRCRHISTSIIKHSSLDRIDLNTARWWNEVKVTWFSEKKIIFRRCRHRCYKCQHRFVTTRPDLTWPDPAKIDSSGPRRPYPDYGQKSGTIESLCIPTLNDATWTDPRLW